VRPQVLQHVGAVGGIEARTAADDPGLVQPGEIDSGQGVVAVKLHAVVDGHVVALALPELSIAQAMELGEDASERVGVLDVDGVQHGAPLLAAIRVREGGTGE
jgi:hypothetical protein